MLAYLTRWSQGSRCLSLPRTLRRDSLRAYSLHLPHPPLTKSLPFVVHSPLSIRTPTVLPAPNRHVSSLLTLSIFPIRHSPNLCPSWVISPCLFVLQRCCQHLTAVSRAWRGLQYVALMFSRPERCVQGRRRPWPFGMQPITPLRPSSCVNSTNSFFTVTLRSCSRHNLQGLRACTTTSKT